MNQMPCNVEKKGRRQAPNDSPAWHQSSPKDVTSAVPSQPTPTSGVETPTPIQHTICWTSTRVFTATKTSCTVSPHPTPQPHPNATGPPLTPQQRAKLILGVHDDPRSSRISFSIFCTFAGIFLLWLLTRMFLHEFQPISRWRFHKYKREHDEEEELEVDPASRAENLSQEERGKRPDLPAHRFLRHQVLDEHLSRHSMSPERHLEALDYLETEWTRQQDGFWGPAVENPEGLQFYPAEPKRQTRDQEPPIREEGHRSFGRWKHVAYQWLEQRFFMNKAKRLPDGKHRGSERWNT